MTETGVRAYWDRQAATFDDEPDHGLSDPTIRDAWRVLLNDTIVNPARVADLGCGTGTLSVLLATLGHTVTGLDLSPAMLDRAREKAAAQKVAAKFVTGDAARPNLPRARFDVVLARHLLWALPDPAAALDRWRQLLAGQGQLILIEGSWYTGAGLTADTVLDLLQHRFHDPTLVRLTDPAYWGREITDERYLVHARA